MPGSYQSGGLDTGGDLPADWLPGIHLIGRLETGDNLPADWIPLDLLTTGTGNRRDTSDMLRQYHIIYNIVHLLVFVKGLPLLIGSVFPVSFFVPAKTKVPILAL